jgi:two-component system, response regulator
MNENENVEVLLVEDNQDDLDLALIALSKGIPPAAIHVARDGAEALDFIFCEGAHAGRKIENTPKMVLLDLNLPKIDGKDVLKRIKSDPRTKNIPVVMLTSSREMQDMIDSYHLAADGFIVKPVELVKFSETVKKLGVHSLLMKQLPGMKEEKPAPARLKLK